MIEQNQWEKERNGVEGSDNPNSSSTDSVARTNDGVNKDVKENLTDRTSEDTDFRKEDLDTEKST